MEKFIHVDRCDSTQDLLKEQLSLNDGFNFTVSCNHQLKGRGRNENTWEDSVGTLCFSINVDPHVKASFTALELSVLVAKFFSTKGKNIFLKWPNDLINSQNKKCAGILVQTSGPHYMAGIGLNLFSEGTEFGGIYESSFDFSKENWSKDIAHFIRENRYTDTIQLSSDWLNHCYHLNKNVKVFEAEQVTEGTFIGLGPYGEALIENNQGIHHLFNGSLRLV